jgi:hypothetical protein
MLDLTRGIAVAVLTAGFALSAQAGPAMFEASYNLNYFGNDITTGTQYPYNTYVIKAAPLGHDCQYPTPYTPNGAPESRYCTPLVFVYGVPVTGTGYLSADPGTGGAITLPMSAFGIDTTGFLPIYYPYLQSNTFAQFVNEQGQFFLGGGAAAGQTTVAKSGKGQVAGTWIVREGVNGFGGAMGLLGRWGANYKFAIVGKPGTYIGYAPGGGVKAFGRPLYATPTQITPMGKTTNWANPHVTTIVATNNVNGNVLSSLSRNSATIWTTGSVRVYALAGGFPTIVMRSGYDTITAGGVRNIQLVSPQLSHWISAGFQGHGGGVNILKLRITPEPGTLLLLTAGAASLALLYRARRRG